MPIRFTNVHSHIFTVSHAPDFFLQTRVKSRALANRIRLLLTAGVSVNIIRAIAALGLPFGLEKKSVNRYIEFFKVGLSASQEEVFQSLSSGYTAFPDYKLVVLTQVLDYMDLEDTTSTHTRIETQVQEVALLKRNPIYTDKIFPFLGCDPRMQKDLLNDWALKYISLEYGFCGIKIYPAYGFYPFDKRFDNLWAWAEKNQIPIMTHNTRSGTWYLGSFESLKWSQSALDNIIDLSTISVEKKVIANELLSNIKSRLQKVIESKKVRKNNSAWCNLFGHPENFELLLIKYPKLKICFAHFGGAEEVLAYDSNRPEKIQSDYPAFLGDNWTGLIIKLLAKFENTYTDISFTISDNDATMKISKIIQENKEVLIPRMMYGTDFFVVKTEKEGEEQSMMEVFNQHLEAYQQQFCYDNPAKFLDNQIVNF